jgi:hypothetical protein
LNCADYAAIVGGGALFVGGYELVKTNAVIWPLCRIQIYRSVIRDARNRIGVTDVETTTILGKHPVLSKVTKLACYSCYSYPSEQGTGSLKIDEIKAQVVVWGEEDAYDDYYPLLNHAAQLL